jgi:hypothetical protein
MTHFEAGVLYFRDYACSNMHEGSWTRFNYHWRSPKGDTGINHVYVEAGVNAREAVRRLTDHWSRDGWLYWTPDDATSSSYDIGNNAASTAYSTVDEEKEEKEKEEKEKEEKRMRYLSKCKKVPVELSFIAPDSGLVRIYTNRWWLVVDDCILFYMGSRPQCGRNESEAEELRDKVYPRGEVMFIRHVYRRYHPIAEL